MEKRDEIGLGTAPVGRLLFRMALPAVAAQVVNMLYNIVDRIYIGHIPVTGAAALTGLGLCMPIICIITAFAALAAFGSSARASIAMGARDLPRAEKLLGGCTALLLLFAVLVTAFVEVFAQPMLYLFGASDDTVVYALRYIRIYAAGSIFVMLTVGLNTFITAQGFTKFSMMTVLLGAGLNILLDPLFIYGFNWGVQGAAAATVLSQAASTVFVVSFLLGKRTLLHLRRQTLRIDLRLMLPCLALGLSPFVMQATEGLINICFNSSLQKYGGDLAVGAMTILSTVTQCSFLVLTGITQGAQPILSYNYGARNADRVQKTFLLELVACSVFSLTIWGLLQLFPGVFTGMMAEDQALRDYAAGALRIYAAGVGLFGIQCACQQTFVSIGNAATSLFLAVLRKLILLIPLIYLLPTLLENKVNAVFLAEPVADVLAVAATATLFFIKFRASMRKLAAPLPE